MNDKSFFISLNDKALKNIMKAYHEIRKAEKNTLPGEANTMLQKIKKDILNVYTLKSKIKIKN